MLFIVHLNKFYCCIFRVHSGPGKQREPECVGGEGALEAPPHHTRGHRKGNKTRFEPEFIIRCVVN